MNHLKEEFNKLTFKEMLVFALAILSIVAGIVMLFLGMYIPPEGQIHETVLTAFGIICLFTGSLLGVSMHYANELTKFKSSALDMVKGLGEKANDN